MKDLKAIIDHYKKTDSSQRCALATVVKVHGSSYRSPGARMVITEDGKWAGSISGGCLEGDALRKARQVMANCTPLTVTYDTREENNQNLGIGLGCNGVIDVLIEPLLAGDSQNPVLLFKELLTTQKPVALATIFSGAEVGHKMLVKDDKIVWSHFTDADLSRQVSKDLMAILNTRHSTANTYKTSAGLTEVFIELIQPTLSLIIFGGGFDARPVSELAKSLGWNVSVTDECVAHIVPVFFPNADKLMLCKRDFVDRDFNITPYTACVLMSHNYEYDRDVLKKLIKTEAPYIGLLGPRKRFDKMQDEFLAEGIRLTSYDMQRIHSPIGLDIGAEAPDEIAVAIIAEIQGVFTNRSGGFLKYYQGPIHHRAPDSDQVFKQVYLASEDWKHAKG